MTHPPTSRHLVRHPEGGCTLGRADTTTTLITGPESTRRQVHAGEYGTGEPALEEADTRIAQRLHNDLGSQNRDAAPARHSPLSCVGGEREFEASVWHSTMPARSAARWSEPDRRRFLIDMRMSMTCSTKLATSSGVTPPTTASLPPASPRRSTRPVSVLDTHDGEASADGVGHHCAAGSTDAAARPGARAADEEPVDR